VDMKKRELDQEGGGWVWERGVKRKGGCVRYYAWTRKVFTPQRER